MNTVRRPMYGWNPETWKKTEKRVFKLQKRIYQASRRGDAGRVRGLQRLLVNSRSGRYLAVRKVTQDNRTLMTSWSCTKNEQWSSRVERSSRNGSKRWGWN